MRRWRLSVLVGLVLLSSFLSAQAALANCEERLTDRRFRCELEREDGFSESFFIEFSAVAGTLGNFDLQLFGGLYGCSCRGGARRYIPLPRTIVEPRFDTDAAAFICAGTTDGDQTPPSAFTGTVSASGELKGERVDAVGPGDNSWLLYCQS